MYIFNGCDFRFVQSIIGSRDEVAKAIYHQINQRNELYVKLTAIFGRIGVAVFVLPRFTLTAVDFFLSNGSDFTYQQIIPAV